MWSKSCEVMNPYEAIKNERENKLVKKHDIGVIAAMVGAIALMAIGILFSSVEPVIAGAAYLIATEIREKDCRIIFDIHAEKVNLNEVAESAAEAKNDSSGN